MQKQTTAIPRKGRSQQHSLSSRHHTGSQSSCFHLVISCWLWMMLRLPRFRRLSMQHSYSHTQTKPADHRVNWTPKQIDQFLQASYARQKVKLCWGNWWWSNTFFFGLFGFFLLLRACVSVYGFCHSFQPQLGSVCSETASATPGGDVSGWRMCYVHFPPAVMAKSAPLLQPCGLDTPLSGLHCELLSFLQLSYPTVSLPCFNY